MSKIRSIQLKINSPLTLPFVVELLKKVELSIVDKNGKIHILNKESYDYELFDYTFEKFIELPKETSFKAFGKEIREVEISIINKDNFEYLDIFVSTYAKKVRVSDVEQFDFNFYYDRIVNKLNEAKCFVEWVIFEEI